jgi:hypothetical protein
LSFIDLQVRGQAKDTLGKSDKFDQAISLKKANSFSLAHLEYRTSSRGINAVVQAVADILVRVPTALGQSISPR